MTPSRARGRPRSEERRDAVLAAAMELIQEDDLRRASVDRIPHAAGSARRPSTNGGQTEPRWLSTRSWIK